MPSLRMIVFVVAFVCLVCSILICFMCVFLAERWRFGRSNLFTIDEESSITLSGTYIDQYCMSTENEKIKIHSL